ncbi:MAG: aminotransferase class I/II-fold pyridoxal phosphate-dependent enzyme [Pseudomonadota bacterium]
MSERHGALNTTELEALGVDAERVLDMSSNCLPGRAHARVRRAAERAAIETYPSPDAAPLRARLAACHGVPAAQVVAGAGAAQLIFAAVQAVTREGDTVLAVQPSFGEYLDAAQALRRRPLEVSVPLGAEPDLTEVFANVERERPALVFVCQPNNPTGRLWPRAQLARLAAVCAETGGRLVVDHAYATFADPTSRFDEVPAAINLYSLTKDYALAGLRLGYAVAQLDDAQAVHRVLPPWSVSAPAMAAGIAALDPEVVVATDAAIRAVRQSAEQLWTALRARRAEVVPSDCHFALVRCPGASAYRLRMLQQCRVQVRSAASFGLPGHIRVCSKGAGADALFLQAWDALGANASADL